MTLKAGKRTKVQNTKTDYGLEIGLRKVVLDENENAVESEVIHIEAFDWIDDPKEAEAAWGRLAEQGDTLRAMASLPPKPFFVVIDGGVCQYVGNDAVDLLNSGKAEVIDFDNFEQDPSGAWKELSAEAQEFFRKTYPDEVKRFKF